MNGHEPLKSDYKKENNGYVQGRRVNKVIEVGRMPFKYAKRLCT